MEISLIFSALIMGTILHFSIQRVFIHYKKFDDFNHRSSHKTLATRTGGIGVFLTLLLISFFFYFQNVELFDYSLIIPLGIMFLVGVYDDLYKADFKLKFFLQIIVAKILIDQGFIISNFHGFLGLYVVNHFFAQITTAFVFLIIVNAINFIDGIDGLAITSVIKTIIVFEIFSNTQNNLSILSVVIISTLISLYYFNFKKKRKVFLGDGGSLLLGTIVSIYIFFVLGENYDFAPKLKMNKVLFSILILLYPLIDLLRVFILRLYNKKSPFIADQKHIHHIVLRKIKSPFYTMLIILVSEIFVLGFTIFIQNNLF